MKQIGLNFVEVFSNWKYLLFSLFTFTVIGYIFFYFTDFIVIKGNFGGSYLYITILFQALISLLFALFIPISVYKYIKFSDLSLKENSSSFFGTFLGVLVAGCPACSITLATYLGLSGIISLLPWYGLELKVLAVPLLGYANYSILKDLNTCKIK